MRSAWTSLCIAASTCAAMLWAGAPTSSAVPEDSAVAARVAVETGDVFASYEGRTINLTKDGWGDAMSCAVHSVTDVRCHSTYAEANAALGYTGTTEPAAHWDCPAWWLCLYEHWDGHGRRLQFNDDYWHDLWRYRFDDQCSSWKNSQITFDWGYLADDGDWDGGNGWQGSLGGGGAQENLEGNRDETADYVQG